MKNLLELLATDAFRYEVHAWARERVSQGRGPDKYGVTDFVTDVLEEVRRKLEAQYPTVPAESPEAKQVGDLREAAGMMREIQPSGPDAPRDGETYLDWQARRWRASTGAAQVCGWMLRDGSHCNRLRGDGHYHRGIDGAVFEPCTPACTVNCDGKGTGHRPGGPGELRAHADHAAEALDAQAEAFDVAYAGMAKAVQDVLADRRALPLAADAVRDLQKRLGAAEAALADERASRARVEVEVARLEKAMEAARGDIAARARIADILGRYCASKILTYAEMRDLENDLAVKPVLAALAKLGKAAAEVEQMRVQLSGVSGVAFGWTAKENRAQRGDYGWSVPYEDVLRLRLSYDRLRATVRAGTQAVQAGTQALLKELEENKGAQPPDPPSNPAPSKL